MNVLTNQETRLSKRETFACFALQGILASITDTSCLANFGNRYQHSKRIANFAVELADALIETLDESTLDEEN